MDYTLEFYVGPFKGFNKYYKTDIEISEYTRGFKTFSKKRDCDVIWMPSFKPNDSKDIGILTHEVTHFVINMGIDHGLIEKEGNNEALSYLMGNTIEYLLKEFKGLRKK
jgi:hypothetical protein